LITYSVLTPTTIRGTIVEFSGGGGTSADTQSGQEALFANDYYHLNYQVVQTRWNGDWENTNDPPQTQTYPYSILIAACRPATFLDFAQKNIRRTGAMCAQGASAGSGAVAYSLVWYGADSYLTAVELLSGPVFGDIEKGCQVGPSAPSVSICSQGAQNNYGCFPGTLNETQPPNQWVLPSTAIKGLSEGSALLTVTLPCDSTHRPAKRFLRQFDSGCGKGFVCPQTNYAVRLCALFFDNLCGRQLCACNHMF
jgi:hypothetical protein